jgi:hypothetical protein
LFKILRQTGQVLGEPSEQIAFFRIGRSVADQRAFTGIDTQSFRLRSHVLHRLLSHYDSQHAGELNRLDDQGMEIAWEQVAIWRAFVLLREGCLDPAQTTLRD